MSVVSVVIPYYNREEWLRPAVESVLGQTFPDFEIIVVDDGSEEVPRFLEGGGDPRIRYVRQEHRGASAARNHGIRLARGKYIAFLDADDIFLSEKLEVQVGRMEARSDVPLSHTSYRRMDAVGNDLEEIRSGTFGGRVYPGIVTRCPIATPTVMVRRETLARQGLAFEESVRIGEDVILWIDVARRHEILGIDRTLTKVRVHGRNAFSDPEALYRGSIEILRHAFRKDTEFGFSFRRRALARVCSSGGHGFLGLGKRKEALRCFARSVAYWPLDPGNLSILLRLFIPERVKPALRRLRDAVRGGGEKLRGNGGEER
jgi:glycosyltransferase involved in cell wall biosynthesis